MRAPRRFRAGVTRPRRAYRGSRVAQEARLSGLDICSRLCELLRCMDVFEALADPRRRQVVQMLSIQPRRAGELADAAGMSAPAMSRHLKTLLDAGVVEDERVRDDARLRMFKLRPQ